MMNHLIGILVIAMLGTAGAEKEKGTPRKGYLIEKPGTITFTVGLKIKGKVEKPQVMIFLPKEQSFFRNITTSHSFRDELLQPLPFTPISRLRSEQ